MNKDPQELIDNTKYQVFLMYCFNVLPAFFATHPWFVINEKGKLSRYDVRRIRTKEGETVHINSIEPLSGIGLFSMKYPKRWPARLAGLVEGDKGSLAYEMVEFIKISAKDYPYANRYSLLGPNSNTYAQWVLDHFPNFSGRLKWWSFGKGYRKDVDKGAI